MINKQSPNSPIGIFDSGLGGLTVLKSLEKILPNESFIYFGDTAHVPYGTKSAETVSRYCQHIMDFFQKHETKAVVIACNTALAVGQWYHIAMARSASSATFYLNGAADGTVSVGSRAISGTNTIGARSSASYPYDGSIGNVQLHL